jgi:3-hydroxy-9,10-secoandrosta-1,3,5(10)-triene-9,17-dione monooxygenase reductase component
VSSPEIDPHHFRTVLGHFPTGVTIVTCAGADGSPPTGMTIGSFTSVSLDPPLVAFLPTKSAGTWAAIEASGGFCVNILRSDQLGMGATFAQRIEDKFGEAGCNWRPGPSGSPILDGVLAWIDCTIEAVHEGGDHWIVVGRVQALEVGHDGDPLLFFQGQYGTFT